MVDRVTKVTLTANVASYLAGMEAASKKTQELGKASEKLAKQGEAFTKIGTASLVAGGVIGVGVGLAVAKFAEFSKEMSQVQTLSHATAAQMTSLSNAALSLGQGIGFSASQVADGEAELVKAGISVSNILGGALVGSLNLAAAGQESVAAATSTAAVAMTQFGLSGKDVPHIADLLAAGADKALGSVSDLGMALNQGGLVAHQFGLSIDDTVGTLSAFANAGLLGSDAGTSLKQMFLQLASPSKQAQTLMSKLGISAYDAQGKFIGITKFAGNLRDSLHGLTEQQRNSAESIIFGSDAIRGANVLYNEGSKGIASWINKVDDTGFAALQASGKMNNLNGDLSKLGASFDTNLIKSGSAANNTLRTLTQDATALVSGIGQIPQPVLSAGLAIGTVAAATALVGGASLVAVPKIAAFKATIADAGISGKTAALGISGVGLAIAGATLAIGYFAAQEADVKSTTDTLQSTLNATTGAVTNLTKAQIAQKLASDGTFAAADKAGISQQQVIAAVLKGGDAASKVGNKIRESSNNVGDFFQGQSFAADKAGTSITNTAKAVRNSQQAFKDLKASGVDASAGTDSVSKSLATITGNAATANQSITDLSNTIKDFGSAQLSADAAQRDFQAAIDDATTALTANGKTLDITNAKGRANAAALDQIASSAISATAAIVNNGGSQADATKQMVDGRAAYLAAAEAAGESAAQANANADALKLIPANVATAFSTPGLSDATKNTADFKAKVDSVPKDKYTKLVADKDAAVKNLDSLNAKLITVPASKKTALLAEISDAQKKINKINAEIIAVPTSKTTTINVSTSAAQQAISALQARLNSVGSSASAAQINKQSQLTKATGGYITGPGSATSDSIPARLSDGEFVLKASAVDRIGVATLNAMNNGYADGGLVGLASGGSVSKAATAAAKKRAAEQAKLAKQLSKLNSDQFSFLSDVARGNLTGSSAVDSLYSTASTRTGPAQVAMLNTALQFDRSLTKLTKSSDAASSKLSDLQSSAASLKSSVAASVGATNVGNYRSATGLENGLSRTATQTHEFASLLHTLQQKGVAPALLSDIANMGTVQGLPLARSLANSSTADIKSINSNYQAIGNFGNYAGQVVSDANYKTQIAAADKNARSLEAQIAKQSLAIQKVIGHALKVPGYSTGGYTGPSRVGDVAGVVHGQEFVVNARATLANRASLERMNAGMAPNSYDRTVYVRSGGGISSTQMENIVKSIVSQMPTAPVTNEFHAHAKENMDPHTAMTIMSRELMRDFAGVRL